MIESIQNRPDSVGLAPVCRALNLPRSSYYRQSRERIEPAPEKEPRVSHRALSEDERNHVLTTLNSKEHVDRAPAAVYTTLLDEGEYLCSVRTMYRILKENEQVRERRRQRRHGEYQKPELLATAPNQVWSWDITKLKGPVAWTYFYLYVIIDIYSRYVVGWMVADHESSTLARELIEASVSKQEIEPGRLTLHSDRGPSMKSKNVALLLSDLGVTKSHSRPYTSNDNPFSESQFRTLKYRPEFPERFGSIQDAQAFCRDFFRWYNTEHYHSGLAMLTPQTVHYGKGQSTLDARNEVLKAAYQAHPERFPKGEPGALSMPEAAWINPPAAERQKEEKLNKLEVEVSQNC
jgi:putative transposase